MDGEMVPDIDEPAGKRAAAVHEAGHLLVAAVRDGKFYSAYIEKNEINSPFDNRKIWIGQAATATE
jgi:hypothetical protein